MTKLLIEKIEACARCPYNYVQSLWDQRIVVQCLHSENGSRNLYSDIDGDSWKAHREIHPSCPLPESGSDKQTEIYRLKEILCVIREIGVVNFDNTTVLLTCKVLDKDFKLPESRFKEILESLS